MWRGRGGEEEEKGRKGKGKGRGRGGERAGGKWRGGKRLGRCHGMRDVRGGDGGREGINNNLKV